MIESIFMIKQLKILIMVLLIYGSVKSFAQEDPMSCNVDMESLKGEYKGDCKKGLAHGIGKACGDDCYEGEFKKGLPHGEGIYTWSNGDKYEGIFIKGKKDGKGKLIYNPLRFDKDSLLIGYWSDDKYIGVYSKPYEVLSFTSPVNRIVIRKVADVPYRIDFDSKGDISMLREKGLNSTYWTGSAFENVKFPVRRAMEANHENIHFSFEFIIAQPGAWEVIIYYD
jgi:hypothetical protein